MHSAEKMRGESDRTKEQHEAAAAYHKEREQIAQSEQRRRAAIVHGEAALLHQEAARCGSDALMTWHRGGDRAVGSIARDWSQRVADVTKTGIMIHS
jgi:hypothetical protein